MYLLTGGPQDSHGGVREAGDARAGPDAVRAAARVTAAVGAGGAAGGGGHEARERRRLCGRAQVQPAPQPLLQCLERRRLRRPAQLQDGRCRV